MRLRRATQVWLIFATGACGVILDVKDISYVDDAGAVDGGDDASGDAARSPGFVLAVRPSGLDLAAGAGASVAVDVTRVGGFTGPIAVNVAGLPPGVSVAPLVIPASASSGTLDITTSGAAFPGRALLTVIGVNATGDISATTTLTLDVHLLPGSLDPSFGSMGIVRAHFRPTVGDYASCLAVQADGKIVVGGQVYSGQNDSALLRLNPNGAPDLTFGTMGVVITRLARASVINAIVVQADGKIVAAGMASNATNTDFAVTRYNPDGTLDASFGTGGTVATDVAGGDDSAAALALQADGKILVAGYAHVGSVNQFAVARYTPAGALDPSFGGTGTTTTWFGAYYDLAKAVVVQPDGRIVAAGMTSDTSSGSAVERFGAARYEPDGGLDPSFGAGGLQVTRFGNGSDEGRAMLLQGTRVIVVGLASVMPTRGFGLLRYTETGALDGTFGDAGKVVTSMGANGSEASGAVLQVDGKIVAVGNLQDVSSELALARYGGNGALDPTFGDAGIVSATLGTSTYGLAVAVQPDRKLIVLALVPGGSDSIAVLRYAE